MLLYTHFHRDVPTSGVRVRTYFFVRLFYELLSNRAVNTRQTHFACPEKLAHGKPILELEEFWENIRQDATILFPERDHSYRLTVHFFRPPRGLQGLKMRLAYFGLPKGFWRSLPMPMAGGFTIMVTRTATQLHFAADDQDRFQRFVLLLESLNRAGVNGRKPHWPTRDELLKSIANELNGNRTRISLGEPNSLFYSSLRVATYATNQFTVNFREMTGVIETLKRLKTVGLISIR